MEEYCQLAPIDLKRGRAAPAPVRTGVDLPAHSVKPLQLLKLSILLCVLSLAFPANAAVKSFPHKLFREITQSDWLMLPPVCRLILVEKPSAHQEQTQNAALLERPEYRMAKGNIHLHHYCYGLVNRNRYFSSKAKLERDRWLIETIAEFEYVLVNSEKEWPYFHQLYFEEAEMYYFAGDLPRALLKAKNSLAHSPGFEKAHALISDIYRKQGNKDQAIQQLHAGLSAEPTSKGLLRRLKDLNPGDPYLKSPRVASEKASPALGAPADEKQTKPTADDIVGETRDVDSTPTSVSKEAPSAAADSVRKGTHTPATPGNADQNPYCRFCP